jgi:hypothetical protein
MPATVSWSRKDGRRVVGDGAVGLCGVIASKRLGADQILLLGSNPERTALGQEFGATDIVPQRGEEAVERVRELTQHGAHSVLGCVGLEQAVETSLAIARPGVAWAFPSATPQPRALRSGGTHRSQAGRRRFAPTSTSYYPTCSRAESSGARLRSHRVRRGRAGGLPRDERPRSAQVPDQAVERSRPRPVLPAAAPASRRRPATRRPERGSHAGRRAAQPQRAPLPLG